MYFLIEDSPSGLSVVGEYTSLEQAISMKVELDFLKHPCNYYISKLVTNISKEE